MFGPWDHQMGYEIPSACSVFVLESQQQQLDVPWKPLQFPGDVLIRCWLTPFYMMQWFYSELLPDVLAPHPIPMGEPSHPAKETNFRKSYPWHHSFGHSSKLVTIDEGWNIMLHFQLLLCHNSTVQVLALGPMRPFSHLFECFQTAVLWATGYARKKHSKLW